MAYIRDEMDDVLEAVAKKHGLKIKVGSVRYSSTEGNFKVKVNTIAADGTVESMERVQFKVSASSYGLDPNWLDQTFIHEGSKYKITGFNTRAKRFPVQAILTTNGTKYKFPTGLVRKCMTP